MCNFEVIEAVREQAEKLIGHTNDLRLGFNVVEEEFREGNLDNGALSSLNQAVHRLEADAAAFQKLLEGQT